MRVNLNFIILNQCPMDVIQKKQITGITIQKNGYLIYSTMETNNYSKEYYLENKKRIRLKQKIYYQKHKQKLIGKSTDYYQENKEEILEKNKNSPVKKAYDKKYYIKFKDKIQHRKKMEYIRKKRNLINK